METRDTKIEQSLKAPPQFQEMMRFMYLSETDINSSNKLTVLELFQNQIA